MDVVTERTHISLKVILKEALLWIGRFAKKRFFRNSDSEENSCSYKKSNI
jgi:hypothetical protein